MNSEDEIKNLINAMQPPWYIKVFGGAFILIIFSIIIGAFQQVFFNLNNINDEIKKQNERMVNKEDYKNQWTAIKEIQTSQTKLMTLEEKIKTIEEKFKKVELENKEIRDELAKTKERITVLEKKATN